MLPISWTKCVQSRTKCVQFRTHCVRDVITRMRPSEFWQLPACHILKQAHRFCVDLMAFSPCWLLTFGHWLCKDVRIIQVGFFHLPWRWNFDMRSLLWPHLTSRPGNSRHFRNDRLDEKPGTFPASTLRNYNVATKL